VYRRLAAGAYRRLRGDGFGSWDESAGILRLNASRAPARVPACSARIPAGWSLLFACPKRSDQEKGRPSIAAPGPAARGFVDDGRSSLTAHPCADSERARIHARAPSGFSVRRPPALKGEGQRQRAMRTQASRSRSTKGHERSHPRSEPFAACISRRRGLMGATFSPDRRPHEDGNPPLRALSPQPSALQCTSARSQSASAAP
jgi:hypothetical protein